MKITTHGARVRARLPKLRDERGSSTAQGYGARWRRIRKAQLGREPLCRTCQEQGRTTAATDVDHITPRRDGGPDTPGNLQSLCRSHHSQKTGRGN